MAERVAASRFGASRASVLSGVDRRAGFGARLFSFLLDSVVLFAFTMLFAAAAFLNIYLRTDSGNLDPSDATIWTSVAILIAAVPSWLLLNLIVAVRRGQTVGQYVVGLRVVKEDGGRPGPLRLLLYFVALHPVLFHPLLACSWALLSYVTLSLSGNVALVLGSLAVTLLSLMGPFVALATIAGDSGRRALHDRIAGVLLTKLE